MRRTRSAVLAGSDSLSCQVYSAEAGVEDTVPLPLQLFSKCQRIFDSNVRAFSDNCDQ
jgi:hypothetical protein